MPLVLYVGDGVPWPEDGPQNLFYSFALFVGGFLLVSEPRLEAAIDNAWKWLAPVTGGLIASQLWLWISGAADRWDAGAISVVLDMWSAAAYPIYLLRESVIIVVAYAVLSAFTMPALPGSVLVSVGSLLATVPIYEAVVKRTNVTRFLFGMKPLPARARSEHPRARARSQVNATAGRVQES